MPGIVPIPGVEPIPGSTPGVGLVSPLPGSPVLGSLVLGNPKLGRTPMPPVAGKRDGNCPMEGRPSEGMLGMMEGLPIEGICIGRLIEGENPIDGAMLREGISDGPPPRFILPPPRRAPPTRPRWATAT